MIGDLRRVDGEFAGEAFAACRFGFGAQALLVLEVGEDAIDGLHAGGNRADEAQRAGELVGEAEVTALYRILMMRPAQRKRSSAPQLIAFSGDLGSRYERRPNRLAAVSVTIA